MRRLHLLLACVAALQLPACLQQLGTDVASSSGSDDASSSAASGGEGGTGGTNCGEDPATQIVLCSDLDECPSITVDPSALAGCGFRIHPYSAVIDLECVCGNYLCPIGVPDTCAQAATVLDGLTSLVVCEQVAGGKCVQEAQPEAGTSSTTSTTSTCDTGCLASCGTAADCLQLCGC